MLDGSSRVLRRGGVGAVLVVALVVGVAGCSSITGSSDSAAEVGEAAVSLDVTPVESQLGESVAEVELTLTPWGEADPIVETLTPDNGEVSATITDLAPGQWDVYVALFGSDESLLAEGSADGVSIQSGEITELSFTLRVWVDPETGALELDVTWTFEERRYNPSVEDCMTFDPTDVELEETDGGTWRIVYGQDGEFILISFGSGDDAEDEALEAMRVIQSYQLTHLCSVDRPNPGLTYWLTHEVAPRGEIGDEDCMDLPPASDLGAEKVSEGSWRVVGDGSSWFSGFDDEGEAERAIEMLDKYEFNEVCFTKGPDGNMTYLKAP